MYRLDPWHLVKKVETLVRFRWNEISPHNFVVLSFKVRCPKAEDEDGNFALEIMFGLFTPEWNLSGLKTYQNLTRDDSSE